MVTKVCDIPTGINAINNNISGLTVSPNPAKGLVAFEIGLTQSEEMQLELTDVIGRAVLTENLGTVNSGSTTKYINVANVKAGIYIYSLKSVNGIKSGKLVVE